MCEKHLYSVSKFVRKFHLRAKHNIYLCLYVSFFISSGKIINKAFAFQALNKATLKARLGAPTVVILDSQKIILLILNQNVVFRNLLILLYQAYFCHI